jgi:chromosome segregation ATPase
VNGNGEPRLDRMDKQIQFLFELHAKSAARLAKIEEVLDRTAARAERHELRMEQSDARWEARQAKLEARQAKLEARQGKADDQMIAIRKLIQTGMKMLVQNQQETKELKATVKAFIDSMKKGSNGNHR